MDKKSFTIFHIMDTLHVLKADMKINFRKTAYVLKIFSQLRKEVLLNEIK